MGQTRESPPSLKISSERLACRKILERCPQWSLASERRNSVLLASSLRNLKYRLVKLDWGKESREKREINILHFSSAKKFQGAVKCERVYNFLFSLDV